VHNPTFEPAHQNDEVSESLRFEEKTNFGKPYNANLYWKTVLQLNINKTEINTVPIIRYLRQIINN